MPPPRFPTQFSRSIHCFCWSPPWLSISGWSTTSLWSRCWPIRILLLSPISHIAGPVLRPAHLPVQPLCVHILSLPAGLLLPGQELGPGPPGLPGQYQDREPHHHHTVLTSLRQGLRISVLCSELMTMTGQSLQISHKFTQTFYNRSLIF